MRIIQPARKARTKNQDGSGHLSSDSNSESGDFLISNNSPNSFDHLNDASVDSLVDFDAANLGDNKTDKYWTDKNRADNTDSEIISPAKKEFNDLLAKGMRLLAMREHSIKEINDKLSAKALCLDTVGAVLDELIKNNYVSDERFTESYVRSRANRGFGPIKIRAELKNRGVSNQLISEYLDIGSVIWLDNARNQYHKKYGDTAVSDYNTWTKRARFMQSRGFTAEHIQVSLPAFDLQE